MPLYRKAREDLKKQNPKLLSLLEGLKDGDLLYLENVNPIQGFVDLHLERILEMRDGEIICRYNRSRTDKDSTWRLMGNRVSLEGLIDTQAQLTENGSCKCHGVSESEFNMIAFSSSGPRPPFWQSKR